MKKEGRIKRIWAVILIWAFMCSSMTVSSFAAANEAFAVSPTEINQTPAIEAYMKLWNSFPKISEYEVAYPDEYGGEFLDGETLYIYIVGLTKEIEEKCLKIMEYPDCVKFLDAEYSLNYLNSFYTEVEEYVEDYNISSYCVDRKANRFKIEIAESSSARGFDSYEKSKNQLSKELNNPAIIYNQGGYVELSANMTGGHELNSDFSLCIGGSYYKNGTYVPAVLTAGHCVWDEYLQELKHDVITYSGVTIGTPNQNACQFSREDFGDYAIIEVTNSSYIPTNDVYYTTSIPTIDITGIQPVSIVGMIFYQYGMISGLLTGVVVDVNVPTTYENIKTLGHTKVEYTSSNNQKGDSGGPVYTVQGTQGTLLGLCHGRIPDTNYGFYSPITGPMNAGFLPLTS